MLRCGDGLVNASRDPVKPGQAAVARLAIHG